MKTLLALLAFAITAFAADVRLQWDDNPPAELVLKYNVFRKQADGTYLKIGETNTPTFTITGLAPGSAYTVAVSATNAVQEGPRSADYTFTIPVIPTAPGGLRHTIIIVP